MPRVADDVLRKVTLNLYEDDVRWFQVRYGQGYSEVIRQVVHAAVSKMKGDRDE